MVDRQARGRLAGVGRRVRVEFNGVPPRPGLTGSSSDRTARLTLTWWGLGVSIIPDSTQTPERLSAKLLCRIVCTPPKLASGVVLMPASYILDRVYYFVSHTRSNPSPHPSLRTRPQKLLARRRPSGPSSAPWLFSMSSSRPAGINSGGTISLMVSDKMSKASLWVIVTSWLSL